MIKNQLLLYFIMGSANAKNAKPLNILEDALKGGITCFQLREKGTGALTGSEKLEFAKACQALCKQYGVPFIINDDVELAVQTNADGVHIGQDDESAASVRKRLGVNKILGVSTHSVEEVKEAIQAGADYVGIGPVYETQSKDDAKPVAGTDFLKQIKNNYPDLPIVGIGGINETNFEPVIQAGADGVAVISAIASAGDPLAAASHLKSALTAAVQKEGTIS